MVISYADMKRLRDRRKLRRKHGVECLVEPAKILEAVKTGGKP